MANHVWSVLCQTTILDRDSKNISLINTIEQIGYSIPEGSDASEPAIIGMELTLVSLWERSKFDKAEDIETRVVIKYPDNSVLHVHPTAVNLKEHARYRSRNIFRNLKFSGDGRYSFIVQKKSERGRWTKVADVPLMVYKAEVTETTRH